MERCPHCGQELGPRPEKCPECGLTLAQTDFAGLADGSLPGAVASGPEEQALARGHVLGGRYEVIAVLGRGGMGWVYMARDRATDGVVALKVIRRDLAKDGDVAKLFDAETNLASKVSHRNILGIHGVVEADGVKFISMPYVEGRDLKSMIAERGALGVSETLKIAAQVAEALESAHEAGIIHRDLKPQNILIDREGTAYVTDFGIATGAVAGALGGAGQIMGTPEYMSPEQAEGREVDCRTDIYSFGLVLYEMLTGRVAFKADTIMSTLMRRLLEHAEPPSEINRSVPEWLDRLTLKALEHDPSRRYPSMGEVLAEIRRHS